MAKKNLKIMHGGRFYIEKWQKSGTKGFSKRIILRTESMILDFSKTKRFLEEAQKEDW